MNTNSNHNGALSVFLVDDDNMFLKSLEHHLMQKLKHNVIIKAFSTGELCLKNLEEKPDIVVLDYFLNSRDQHAMNGVQVLEKIKLANPETAVIMLSGQDKMQVAVDSMRHGAFDYVVKNESAFLRAQNVIKNAINALKTSNELKYYKMFLWILLSAIALIGIAAVIVTTVFSHQLVH
jgi:two-component system, OmpR family, response regulator